MLKNRIWYPIELRTNGYTDKVVEMRIPLKINNFDNLNNILVVLIILNKSSYQLCQYFVAKQYPTTSRMVSNKWAFYPKYSTESE